MFKKGWWKNNLWEKGRAEDNVALMIAIVGTAVLWGVYYFVMPTINPIYFRSHTPPALNSKIEFALGLVIIMGIVQVCIMLTLRSMVISLVFWIGLHVVVGLVVAPVLWDVARVVPQDVLMPGEAFVGLLLVYFLRFANSEVLMFLTTRGRYY
ncbi:MULTISPECIES: hypothetical protein [Halomonadaceae]|uniref:hypothetical protein n=1 Tax=Halomonadaceae TaxID=28256 RepID=UPI003FD7F530